MDLTFPLLQLRDQRKIFHSEADFQFALAWEIQKYYPEAKIRLEYCPAEIEPSMYIDILVIMNELWYPIELKYKTLKGIKEYNGEIFKLKNHGAQDLGRYDYLLDIMRIERLSKTITVFGKGYAILLTNDPAYWFDTPRRDTVYHEFRLNDGVVKTGEMKWADHVGVGTSKGRSSLIILDGSYIMQWNDYCQLDDRRSGTFRYLISTIEKA